MSCSCNTFEQLLCLESVSDRDRELVSFQTWGVVSVVPVVLVD